jgi:osmotically-inducible protein OsmY
MIKRILLLLAVVLLTWAGWHFYRTNESRLERRAAGAAAQTREAAATAGEQAASSARQLGDLLRDASIVVRIKGKHLVDPDLSVLAINVDCTNGRVKLTGSAKTQEQIQRAVRLAEQTGGVSVVTSELVVRE